MKFNASKWRIAVKTDDDDYLTSSGFYASGSAWRLSQPPKVQQYDLDGISNWRLTNLSNVSDQYRVFALNLG